MMNAKLSEPSMPSATTTESLSESDSISIWIRLGLPAGLAIVAGLLNANAVERRLNAVDAFVLPEAVRAGEAFSLEQLSTVSVGGTLDRDQLLTTDDLATLLKSQTDDDSIERALKRRPLTFVRNVSQGELLTDSCLAVQERLSSGEGIVDFPIDKIHGDYESLRPGNLVYFDVFDRTRYSAKPEVQEIGPFRVAVWERRWNLEREKGFLKLVYRVDHTGKKTADAKRLCEAAYIDNGLTLAIVEKPSTAIQ